MERRRTLSAGEPCRRRFQKLCFLPVAGSSTTGRAVIARNHAASLLTRSAISSDVLHWSKGVGEGDLMVLKELELRRNPDGRNNSRDNWRANCVTPTICISGLL